MGTNQTAESSDEIPLAENTPSADKVAANDDLLSEILRRLPIKSLFRFKSVSKHWLLLITDPNFAHCRNPDPSSVHGLFVNVFTERKNPRLEFIPLHDDTSPDDDLTSIPGLLGIKILSSCHGLLCCFGYTGVDRKGGHHVLNPSTKQFATLPEPHLAGLQGLSLAFDPSRSPHYKVVCVWETITRNPPPSQSYFQIEIYSSETGSWRASGESFTTDAFQITFSGGVYWNGSIHWCCDWGDSLYFNVDQERLGTMPMPPLPQGKEYYDRSQRYQLESRDHLHMVEIYAGTTAEFNIYEMERDYSGWFVKYRVDLDAVGAAFPKMMEAYWVLSLVREEEDDESFLVLHIPPGKVIRYNLVDNTFKPVHYKGSIESPWHLLHTVHQYIESYSCV